MTQKIILVSQAPGKAKGEPLAGASGRRLAALAGLSLDDFLRRFERVNLLPEHPGKDGKGDKFDLPAARAEADQLREKWRGRKAVLLGRGVMAAFRILPDDAGWFQPVEVPPGVEVACMPHPSGISHWWNSTENVERAREFMQRLNVGFFTLNRFKPKLPKKGRPELFRPEQVAAAIIAADGIMLHAAKFLAEETGIDCDRTTAIHYVERYPDLAKVRDQAREGIVDIAEGNVAKAVRAGDVESSRWLLRSKLAAGRGYELAVSGRVDGEVVHTHKHELTVKLQDAARRLIDATNRAGNIIDLPEATRVRSRPG